eukprot:SAG31_NODE_5092_length_2748_cov_1.716874_1_plen_219_part_00
MAWADRYRLRAARRRRTSLPALVSCAVSRGCPNICAVREAEPMILETETTIASPADASLGGCATAGVSVSVRRRRSCGRTWTAFHSDSKCLVDSDGRTNSAQMGAIVSNGVPAADCPVEVRPDGSMVFKVKVLSCPALVSGANARLAICEDVIQLLSGTSSGDGSLMAYDYRQIPFWSITPEFFSYVLKRHPHSATACKSCCQCHVFLALVISPDIST